MTLKNCKAETARHALSMNDGFIHPNDGKLTASIRTL
nr:MAG TPA: Forkhead box protein P2/DNA Complex, Double-Helix, Swapping, Homodimer, Monomer.9A [Caudoviricetes sp.]